MPRHTRNRCKTKQNMVGSKSYLDVIAVLEECRSLPHRPHVKEVEIVIDGPSIESLCTALIEYLYWLGVTKDGNNGSTDTANLLQVVHAVVVAKIANGKLLDFSPVEYALQEQVELRFRMLPKILNAYIKQIGTFTYDGTKFTPKTAEGLCFRIVVGERVLTPVDPDFDDSFNDLMKWYQNFIRRCELRNAVILEQVVFANGIGTAAQLVGCHDCPRTLKRETWCYKQVSQNVLELGGLFGFGLDSRDKFHDKDISMVFDRMNVNQLFEWIHRYEKC